MTIGFKDNVMAERCDTLSVCGYQKLESREMGCVCENQIGHPSLTTVVLVPPTPGRIAQVGLLLQEPTCLYPAAQS